MLSLEEGGWKIFEAYTRALMANKAAVYHGRLCVAKKIKIENNPEFSISFDKTLGGCKEIRLVLDIVKAAKKNPNVIFHSVDRSYELIDFIYQDGTGQFHAFQVTLQKDHTADPEKIKNLEQSIGDPNKLSIYYLVPDEQFMTFVTKPVNPREGGVSCDLYHVLIPAPKK